jgi:hypothetical protein
MNNEQLIMSKILRKAVQLDLAIWEEIIALLEKLADQEAAEAVAEQRWDELFTKSADKLASLAREARAEYRAGQTEPLDKGLA